MNPVTTVKHVIVAGEHGIVHFFHDTSTGKAIEHLGQDIISEPGLHAFISSFESTIKADLKAGLQGLENPTSESLDTYLVTFVNKVKTDAESAVKTGLLSQFHGSFANFVVSKLYLALKTEIPALAAL
ncbi:MAG: hypothetical protein ACREDR_00085 [Blastocatellia bacterium]